MVYSKTLFLWAILIFSDKASLAFKKNELVSLFYKLLSMQNFAKYCVLHRLADSPEWVIALN